MAAEVVQVTQLEIDDGAVGQTDKTPKSRVHMWSDMSLLVSKAMSVYCGISLLLLCVMSWLILSDNISAEILEADLAHNGQLPSVDSPPRAHSHDSEFYMFILTLLVSLRGGLFYMASALKRPIKERNVSTIGTWIIGQSCILVAELILSLSLLECLPGFHILILLFLFVEIIAQASFIWVIWNFKMEVMADSA